MNLDQELQEFEQKYADLEQQAERGSLKRHVYNQIMVHINAAKHVTPALQRAFETRNNLDGLAKVLDPPSERHIVWETVKQLERIANLPPNPFRISMF